MTPRAPLGYAGSVAAFIARLVAHDRQNGTETGAPSLVECRLADLIGTGSGLLEGHPAPLAER